MIVCPELLNCGLMTGPDSTLTPRRLTLFIFMIRQLSSNAFVFLYKKKVFFSISNPFLQMPWFFETHDRLVNKLVSLLFSLFYFTPLSFLYRILQCFQHENDTSHVKSMLLINICSTRTSRVNHLFFHENWPAAKPRKIDPLTFKSVSMPLQLSIFAHQ